MARFGTRFGGAWGILPRSRTNQTHKPYIDELQILFSLCIPRHDFATAVKGAISEQLRDMVGCAFLIHDVRAAGLQLALIFYAGMWNSWYVNYTTFAVNTVSFVFVDVELTSPGAFINEKVPGNRPFRDPFWRGMGHLAPRRGISHTQAIHRWITNVVQFISAKAWLRHCSERCHLRTAARQGWVCLSDIHFQCVHAAGLQLATLICTGMWNSG